MNEDHGVRVLLKPHEAAMALGLSVSKVYELMASGALGSVTVGRSRRVPVKAVDAFVEALSRNAHDG